MYHNQQIYWNYARIQRQFPRAIHIWAHSLPWKLEVRLHQEAMHNYREFLPFFCYLAFCSRLVIICCILLVMFVVFVVTFCSSRFFCLHELSMRTLPFPEFGRRDFVLCYCHVWFCFVLFMELFNALMCKSLGRMFNHIISRIMST